MIFGLVGCGSDSNNVVTSNSVIKAARDVYGAREMTSEEKRKFTGDVRVFYGDTSAYVTLDQKDLESFFYEDEPLCGVGMQFYTYFKYTKTEYSYYGDDYFDQDFGVVVYELGDAKTAKKIFDENDTPKSYKTVLDEPNKSFAVSTSNGYYSFDCQYLRDNLYASVWGKVRLSGLEDFYNFMDKAGFFDIQELIEKYDEGNAMAYNHIRYDAMDALDVSCGSAKMPEQSKAALIRNNMEDVDDLFSRAEFVVLEPEDLKQMNIDKHEIGVTTNNVERLMLSQLKHPDFGEEFTLRLIETKNEKHAKAGFSYFEDQLQIDQLINQVKSQNTDYGLIDDDDKFVLMYERDDGYIEGIYMRRERAMVIVAHYFGDGKSSFVRDEFYMFMKLANYEDMEALMKEGR